MALIPGASYPGDPALSLTGFDGVEEGIDKVSGYEVRRYILDTLLRDSDVMSLASALKLRTPLLNEVSGRKFMVIVWG